MQGIIFLAVIAISGILALLLLLGANATLCRVIGICVIALEGVYIGVRWAATGHPPILGTFEETLAASWFLTLFFVIRDKNGVYGRVLMPFAFLTLLYGLTFDRTPRPLIISEQSWWVYFHALFAWLSYGFYTLCLASAIRLLRGRNEESAPLQDSMLFGFTAQIIMYGLGAYYSSRLHGAWWIWDPVEYLFILSWMLYAIPMHGRLFLGWKTRTVAVWVIVAFIGTILLYWSLIYIPWATYHIFDPEIKIHGTFR